MTTPHHPDQNQPCKTKQNTLLSSAIHRNPTDVSSQFAMILILPWFCKPKAMIVHQKKTGRFPLSLKLHLFNLFLWSQDTKLTQQFHRMHTSKCAKVKHHSWSTATRVSSRPASTGRSWKAASQIEVSSTGHVLYWALSGSEVWVPFFKNMKKPFYPLSSPGLNGMTQKVYINKTTRRVETLRACVFECFWKKHVVFAISETIDLHLKNHW